MEASKVFCDIITKIENSRLNYRILKTPFSASISIKSSFVKYFVEPEDLVIPVKREEDRKPKLSSDLQIAEEDKLKLLEIIRQEKSKVKTFEEQIGDLREELVKIKKERKNLNTDLKATRTELEEIKVENILVQKVMEDFKDKLNVKNETLRDSEIESVKLKNERVLLERELEKSALEISFLKNEKCEPAKKEEHRKHSCVNCEMEHESLAQLRQHIRSTHFKDQVSQTRFNGAECDFVEYACFYCRKQLTSLNDLEDHKPICYNIKDFTLYPCDFCGAQCPDEASLGRHRTTYHELGTFSKELGVEFFYCDICPSNYRSKVELRVHMCYHDEEFG